MNVLELGCGSGELHSYWAPNWVSYLGVDFSPRMLKRFRDRHHGVTLTCADICTLPLRLARYDLIFANGVFQYLDRESARDALTEIRRLMAHETVVVIAGIPDWNRRLAFYAGLANAGGFSARRLVFSVLNALRGFDGIGHWHTRSSLEAFARDLSLRAEFVDSRTYAYRFHVRLSCS
jgi:SAM-dependent methyltransferase